MRILRWVVIGAIVIVVARRLDRSPRPQRDFDARLDEALDEMFPGRDPQCEFATPDVAEAMPQG